MAEIAPFNEQAACPKCGHTDISTQFRSFYSTFVGCVSGCPDEEHMHRTCRNCGYRWPEACRDENPATPEPRGLYGKYRLYKADTGEEITDPVFILRPDHDPVARLALRLYASRTSDILLTHHLSDWLDRLDALPKEATPHA